MFKQLQGCEDLSEVDPRQFYRQAEVSSLLCKSSDSQVERPLSTRSKPAAVRTASRLIGSASTLLKSSADMGIAVWPTSTQDCCVCVLV